MAPWGVDSEQIDTFTENVGRIADALETLQKLQFQQAAALENLVALSNRGVGEMALGFDRLERVKEAIDRHAVQTVAMSDSTKMLLTPLTGIQARLGQLVDLHQING